MESAHEEDTGFLDFGLYSFAYWPGPGGIGPRSTFDWYGCEYDVFEVVKEGIGVVKEAIGVVTEEVELVKEGVLEM